MSCAVLVEDRNLIRRPLDHCAALELTSKRRRLKPGLVTKSRLSKIVYSLRSTAPLSGEREIGGLALIQRLNVGSCCCPESFKFRVVSLRLEHFKVLSSHVRYKSAHVDSLQFRAVDMEARNNNSSSITAHEFSCCCEISWEQFQASATTPVFIFISTVLVLTSISAVVGNSLVLASIWRTPSLHSPSNVLIVGLAVSDLCVGLFVEPTAFVFDLARHIGSAHVFCYAAVLLWWSGIWLTLTSLITVTAISVDFYLALHLHLRYKELVTVGRMVRAAVGIWVFAFAATLLRIWCPKHLAHVYVSLVCLCLLVTTTAYFKVFRIVHRHQTQIQSLELQVQEPAGHEDGASMNITEQRKSLIAKFLIYCLLIVCYLPLSVTMTLVQIRGFGSADLNTMHKISIGLVCFNSTLNPFIYCWRFHNIRSAVIETARKIFRLDEHSDQNQQG